MPDTIRLSAVTLDCSDARSLAAFYGAITGGTVTDRGPEWAMVQGPDVRLSFQSVPGYRPPVWPDPAASIMMHLDFLVTDRAATEARVLAAGATKLAFQPNSGQCSVYADPAGHPFCLTTFDGVTG